MKYSIVTAAALLAGSVLTNAATAAEQTKDSLPTVQKKIAEKKAVLVDVREKSEWDKGHVEGAIFLPLSALKDKADPAALSKVLPKDKVIYTHCVVGKRSLTAANILETLGYDVQSLKPGYEELVKSGFKKAKD